MNNTNWAPIIGGVLLIGSVAGFALNYFDGQNATVIIALALSLLGIHDTNVKLGRSFGARK
jgi:hypothetical protein